MLPQELFPILEAYSNIGSIKTDIAEQALLHDTQILLTSLKKPPVTQRHNNPQNNLNFSKQGDFYQNPDYEFTTLTKNLESIRIEIDKQRVIQNQTAEFFTAELKRSEAQISLLKELLLY